MEQKKDLLCGAQKIFDFSSTDMCYLLMPKSEGGSIDLVLNYYDYSCITVRIDRLLGKWLKIKKYFILPKDEHFCSLLFIQPIWRNPGFALNLFDSTHLNVWHAGWSRTFDSADWLKQNLAFQLEQRTGKYGLDMELPMSMPFVFIQLKSKITTLGDAPIERVELKQEDIQIGNYYGETLPSCRLINTSDPEIYLLVFSDLLQTSKDCAKLMRRFLKNPDNPVWAADCTSVLYCDCPKSIILTFPKIHGKSQLPGYDSWSEFDYFSSDNFEDRVFLDAIQAFGISNQ